MTPRMFVPDVAAQVEFLRRVFDATGEVHEGRPVELHIGDSVVMVSDTEARGQFLAYLYVYVPDVDATFALAVGAGATVIEPPADQFYGDRRATVSDPAGNVYQIATAAT